MVVHLRAGPGFVPPPRKEGRTVTPVPPEAYAPPMHDLVERAELAARIGHIGQTDKCRRPYIEHPERVAQSVRHLSKEAQAAAWLHDLVEDTPATLSDVNRAFGERVTT